MICEVLRLSDSNNEKKIPTCAFVALLLTLLFLSGIFTSFGRFKDEEGAKRHLAMLAALDFNNVVGQFGSIGSLKDGAIGKLAKDFKGIGGRGAREAFLLALTLAPSIIVAFGVIEVCTNYKGLRAAEVLFTPIVKPILGLPGSATIALVTSLTSSDAAAGITKELYEEKYLDDTQRTIFMVFQFSAPSIIVNFYAIGPALTAAFDSSVPIMLAFGVILVMKFVGAIVFRLFLKFNKGVA